MRASFTPFAAVACWRDGKRQDTGSSVDLRGGLAVASDDVGGGAATVGVRRAGARGAERAEVGSAALRHDRVVGRGDGHRAGAPLGAVDRDGGAAATEAGLAGR